MNWHKSIFFCGWSRVMYGTILQAQSFCLQIFTGPFTSCPLEGTHIQLTAGKYLSSGASW